MEAKTLEQLGFTRGEDNKHFLVYSISFEKSVIFKKLINQVELSGSFTYEELQAINQQMKEIGEGK